MRGTLHFRDGDVVECAHCQDDAVQTITSGMALGAVKSITPNNEAVAPDLIRGPASCVYAEQIATRRSEPCSRMSVSRAT
jgi:hypothetical protein